MRFVACKTRREFTEAAGFDWAKIAKVCGGYMGFETVSEYQTWRKTK